MTWPLDFILAAALLAILYALISQVRKASWREGAEKGYAAGVLAGIEAAEKLQRKLREQAEHDTGLPKIETREQAHKLADNIDRQRGRGELQ